MAPRVLLSTEKTGGENYKKALRAAGAEAEGGYCPAAGPGFDGLLLCGGGDMDPALFGQEDRGSHPPDPERDRAELALVRSFLGAGKPILGICRGAQVLNVALGGTLVQDLGRTLNPFHVWDRGDKVHPISAPEGSLLRRLYGPVFPVNSAHHQAADRPGEGLWITARSEGGVAEALEDMGRGLLGVQFHPERMTGALRRSDTVDGGEIFRWFLERCRG